MYSGEITHNLPQWQQQPKLLLAMISCSKWTKAFIYLLFFPVLTDVVVATMKDTVHFTASCINVRFSSAPDIRQHKVIRGWRPAGSGGFAFHARTVLWIWRMSANGLKECSRWLEWQRWNFVCGVPLLFSAWPDLHVPQNGDRLGQEDSPSVCRHAGNMRYRRLGYSSM